MSDDEQEEGLEEEDEGLEEEDEEEDEEKNEDEEVNYEGGEASGGEGDYDEEGGNCVERHKQQKAATPPTKVIT